jgi:choline-glycine betaine transporter
MFYFLANKTFRVPVIILLIFGVFLYFIEGVSEYIISSLSGVSFEYFESPFLKLIYLLLLVVTIGFLSALNKNELVSEEDKKKSVLSFLFITITATLIGLGLHIYFVTDVILSGDSMMDLEQSYILYFITDFFLMIGYIIGGFKFLRPAIHQN